MEYITQKEAREILGEPGSPLSHRRFALMLKLKQVRIARWFGSRAEYLKSEIEDFKEGNDGR